MVGEKIQVSTILYFDSFDLSHFGFALVRINEFNVEAVLALFLPYHESPHFAKMITILQLK